MRKQKTWEYFHVINGEKGIIMAVKDPKVMAAITAAISAYLAEEWLAMTAAAEVEAPPVGAGYVEIMCPQCGYIKRITLS